MNAATFLFWLIAAFTGVCAIAVVVSQNIVRAAAYLLFTLAGTAGIFFLLSADFVGATQLIVYVGGILVLVVFGVMLTAQGPFITMKTGAAEWVIAMTVGLLLYGVLAYSVFTAKLSSELPTKVAEQSNSSVRLGVALMGVADATPGGDITGVPERSSLAIEKLSVAEKAGPHGGSKEGNRTKVAYLLPFEIVSVHLLVVLIGAAYLARAKRRRGATA